MNYIVTQPEQGAWVKMCKCGKFPNIIQPNYDYTDLWLQCECGRRTINTGGFHYAREIPRYEALEKAVALWTLDDVIEEDNNDFRNSSS